MVDDYWTKSIKGAVKTYLTTSVGCPGTMDIVLPRASRIVDLAAVDVDSVDDVDDVNGMAIADDTVKDGATYCRVGRNIYITKYADLTVCPYAGFHLKVLRDLREIARHNPGKRLLKSLNKVAKNSHAKTLVIKFCNGFMRTSQANLAPGDTGGDWNTGTYAPATVPGQYVTVEYNPQMFGLPTVVGLNDDGPELQDGEWGAPDQKPPDVTLFHEMVHADDYFRGVFLQDTALRGHNEQVKISELRCVGMDEFDQPEIYSENLYRAARGVARRDYYTKQTEMDGGPVFMPTVSKFWHPHKYKREKRAFRGQVQSLTQHKRALALHLMDKLGKITP